MAYDFQAELARDPELKKWHYAFMCLECSAKRKWKNVTLTEGMHPFDYRIDTCAHCGNYSLLFRIKELQRYGAHCEKMFWGLMYWLFFETDAVKKPELRENLAKVLLTVLPCETKNEAKLETRADPSLP